jgi:hypothetical protein
MVRARSGSRGPALLTGESRLGTGAGELAQRELDDGQRRLRRVGAKLHPGIAMSPIVPLYWRDAPAQSADDFASAGGWPCDRDRQARSAGCG